MKDEEFKPTTQLELTKALRRDLFAASALAGLLAYPSEGLNTKKGWVELAFQYADLMMHERRNNDN